MTDLTELARDWVERLPSVFVGSLATALRSSPSAVMALRDGSHGTASKAAVETALAVAKVGDGPYLAGLLVGYRVARADQPRVTPVWTGPESGASGSRLTLAVVAGLIDEARSELLLVSYATAPSAEVKEALMNAAHRGVGITSLLERGTDNPSFSGNPDPLRGIEHTGLIWPAAAREAGASMHAKILVVDRTSALIGSANLTGYGVERNLECGVLIRGGTLPGALVDHITSANGITT